MLKTTFKGSLIDGAFKLRTNVIWYSDLLALQRHPVRNRKNHPPAPGHLQMPLQQLQPLQEPVQLTLRDGRKVGIGLLLQREH